MNLKAMAMVSLAGLAVAAAGCGNLADSPVEATAVRYASDGTLVVFAGSVIDTYGPDLAQPKVHVSVHGAPEPVFSASDDGRVAAVASTASGDVVQMFDLSSGQRTSVLHLGRAPSGATFWPMSLTLSPTGDLLFVIAVDGGLRGDLIGGAGLMFDASTGTLLWSGTTPLLIPPLFSADESTLYLPVDGPVLGGGSLLGMDSQTGTMNLDVPLVDPVKAFGGMADPNTLIAVAESLAPGSYTIESTEIELLSTADGSVSSQVLLPENTTFSGSFSGQFDCAPAVGWCVMGTEQPDPNNGGPLIQVRSLDGTLVRGIDDDGYLALSPDGQYVAVAVSGDVAIYAVSDGSLVKILPYRSQIL